LSAKAEWQLSSTYLWTAAVAEAAMKAAAVAIENFMTCKMKRKLYESKKDVFR
jgi:hypothetical protein